MLRDIDQGHGEIAGRVENGQAERAHQDDIARGGSAMLPEQQHPGEQRDRQCDCHERMADAQALEITQADFSSGHLLLDSGIEPMVFARNATEGFDNRDIANDVGQFAVHGGSTIGKLVVQGLPAAAIRNITAMTSIATTTSRPPCADSPCQRRQSRKPSPCRAAAHSTRACSPQ